jgi:hypothetical protein
LEKAAGEVLGWHQEQPLERSKFQESPRWATVSQFYEERLGYAFPAEVQHIRRLRHVLVHQRGELRSEEQRRQFGDTKQDTEEWVSADEVELTEESVLGALNALAEAVNQVDAKIYRVSWGGEQLPAQWPKALAKKGKTPSEAEAVKGLTYFVGACIPFNNPGASLPDRIGAIATAGTLGVGLFLLFREIQYRRNEQSRLVSAWVEAIQELRTSDQFGHHIAPMPGAKSVRIRARNGSAAPVYRFEAWVRHHYGADSRMTAGQPALLPPGETLVWVDFVQLPEGGLAGFPEVDITYTDEGGKRWSRSHDGRIRREGSESRRFGRFGREREAGI